MEDRAAAGGSRKISGNNFKAEQEVALESSGGGGGLGGRRTKILENSDLARAKNTESTVSGLQKRIGGGGKK